MTLHHDLDRLRADLEARRKQLEEHMSEGTLARASTDSLAEKLRQLRNRIEITARVEPAPGEAPAPAAAPVASLVSAVELE